MLNVTLNSTSNTPKHAKSNESTSTSEENTLDNFNQAYETVKADIDKNETELSTKEFKNITKNQNMEPNSDEEKLQESSIISVKLDNQNEVTTSYNNQLNVSEDGILDENASTESKIDETKII